MANILVNTIGITLFLTACAFIQHFRKCLKYDRQRYQLFAVRDKLYELAMKNRIDQQAPEYRFTEALISKSISAVKNYDIYMLFLVLKDFDKLQESAKKHQTYLEKIKKNKQLSEVYKEFTSVTMGILRENSLLVQIVFTLNEVGLFYLINKLRTLKIREDSSVEIYRGFHQWNRKFA